MTTNETHSASLPGDGKSAPEVKTDLAEDRTLLANERTFASWVRTSMASIGIGLAFHALFSKVEPLWFAKAVSSVFIVLGTWIIWRARSRADALLRRSTEHKVHVTNRRGFLIIAGTVTAGAVGLAVAIWVLV